MTDDKPISKLDEVEYSEDYPVPELDLDRYRPYLEDIQDFLHRNSPTEQDTQEH